MVHTGSVPTFQDVPLPSMPADPPVPKLSRREAARVMAEHFEALERASDAVEAARDSLADVVSVARRAGFSWQDVGEALGIDRETARRRYGVPDGL